MDAVAEPTAPCVPRTGGESVRGAGRYSGTRIREAAPAHFTAPAIDLERHDDTVTGLCHRDSVANGNDFARDLVPECEWSLHRKQPGGDVQVQVAAGHGKRPDQSLFVAFQARCFDVPPLELAGLNKRELPHRRHDNDPPAGG